MSGPRALLSLLPLLLLQGGFPGAAGDSVTLKEGENLKLACTFSSLSSNSSSLQWLNPAGFTIFLNAQQVLRDQRYKLLHYSQEELSIQLSNVTVQDEGIYSCFYYSKHFQSKRQNVEILAAPSHPVLEVSQDAGRGINISCHSQGSKPQPQISWLLDNGIELSGDTRHQLGADGKKWSTSSTLRILSYSPQGTASCILQHPALRGERLMASLPFQDLPSPGCNQPTRLSEGAEGPSPSENRAVPSSPENPAGTSPSASPKDPEVSSPSASPGNPEDSSPSASPKYPVISSPSSSSKDTEDSSPSSSPQDPEVSSPSASPKYPVISSPSSSSKDKASSPSSSPQDPGVSSPSASPGNPEDSSPSASPQDPEVSSPSSAPNDSSPSASPKDPEVSIPSSSPENAAVSSPSASPKYPVISSPSSSSKDTENSSPSASPQDPEISIPSSTPNDSSPSSSPQDPEVSSPSSAPNDSSPSASPQDPEVSSPSASPENPGVSSPSSSPKSPEVSSSAPTPAQPTLTDVTSNGTETASSANGTEEGPPRTEVPPACENTTGISTPTLEQDPESKGFVKKEKNLLLPMLVAALIFVLLIIVLLFMMKLKKAHGVWKRENDVSEQTLESYKSRSNEDSPGHERNGQAVKSNMQYVTEEHVETPEKTPETPEKNPVAMSEKIFHCGRETDV